MDEIRCFNDVFRRVYPAYLDNTAEDPEKVSNKLTQPIKSNFLASNIAFKFNSLLSTEDSFTDFDNIETLGKNINCLPNYIIGLLGESFNPLNPERKINLYPISDDRMFTMCCVENDPLINKLKLWSDSTNEYQYTTDPEWHKLIYIDGNQVSCKGKSFLKQLNKSATYERWLDSDGPSQLYGITPYSFVLLVSEKVNFNEDFIKKHFTHQYYQMVLLSLVQYGSIVSYSSEVQIIAGKIKEKRNKGKIRLKRDLIDLIEELHQNYLIFINRIYFRQVTPQLQGMELYSLLQNQMGIPEDAKMLKAEVEELKSFVLNHESKVLNRIASKFLPASVLISFFAWFIDDIKVLSFTNFDISRFAVVTIWAVIATLITILINKFLNK
ncbi:MAG: hypothetical protein JNL49_02855 [Bacteroidia bacterium]|nr:hypothetical protein [Bacteroidia bacterium]